LIVVSFLFEERISRGDAENAEKKTYSCCKPSSPWRGEVEDSSTVDDLGWASGLKDFL
jgi:hypothetical protein